MEKTDKTSKPHAISYHCIECGAEVDSLYRDFKAGIIKISHCKSCGAVADKYIECDPVIIFLDALLLQLQPYRHLLINTELNSHWKLALLLWVCDAFTKLVLQRSGLPDPQTVNYSYLGVELYVNYTVAAVELLTLLFSVLFVFAVNHLWQHGSLKEFNSGMITKAINVSSLGRVLAIPALMWGQSYSSIFVWLCQGFVWLSTLQAVRVVNEGRYSLLWTILAVACGFSAQLFLSVTMESFLKSSVLFT